MTNLKSTPNQIIYQALQKKDKMKKVYVLFFDKDVVNSTELRNAIVILKNNGYILGWWNQILTSYLLISYKTAIS